MKRIVAWVAIIALLASFALPAFATEFVPSIENKGAPEILSLGEDENPTHGTDGKIIGYAKDENGEIKDTAYHGCLVVYSLRDILDPEVIVPEDVKEQLLEIYTDFTSGNITPSQLSEALNAEVADIFGEGNNADMLVIKDIFDISVICEQLKTTLSPKGTTIDLTFDVDIPADGYVAMLAYKNDEWVMVEKIVNNNENDIEEDDGTITVTFEDFCPIVLLVPGDAEPVAAEEASFPWWILLLIAAAGGTGYGVSRKKKEEK